MAHDWNLIGLVGHAGAGKDTAAAGLARLGYENTKFAAPLKGMLYSLLARAGTPSDEIARMIEGDLKEVPCDALCGRTPRHAMQTLGTEWGRECIDRDLWAQVALAGAVLRQRVVFTDCRFQNEAAAIRTRGGVLLRITRPGLVVDLSHPSEAEVPLIECDDEMVNDTHSPEQFANLVRIYVESQL